MDMPKESIIYEVLLTLKDQIIDKDILRRIELLDSPDLRSLRFIHLVLALNKVEYWVFVIHTISLA